MMPKVSDPGSDFHRILDYDFKRSKNAELLGGTLGAESPRALAAELDAWRALNERGIKPVFHCSLSAAPDDSLTAARWLDIAGEFMQRMGFGDSPWAAVRHHDTPVDHIHIVTCRIDHDGRYVSAFRTGRRSQEVCRAIESARGLHQVTPASRRDDDLGLGR
jgi:hypothetical protein